MEVSIAPADRIASFSETCQRLRTEVRRVIVGQDDVVDGALLCLLADWHALLEGVPGLGKTLLVRTLADALTLKFSRMQFTPDLMPADIVGTNILYEAETGRREFRFQAGPVFANIILADEINRATPKTQSALLEAMQEHSVTVAGQIRRLEEPFLVMATQNPIEMEGTYPLPEAQLDRFFLKLVVRYPSLSELDEIMNRTTGEYVPKVDPVADGPQVVGMQTLVREVPIASHVQRYALTAVMATHPDWEQSPDIARRYVRYGSSPRGGQALVLAGKIAALLDGRFNVSLDDIRGWAAPALRHRILLNFEGEAEGINTDDIVKAALETADKLIGQEVRV